MAKKKKVDAKQKLFQTALVVFILILVVLLIKQLPVSQQTTLGPSNRKSASVQEVERIEISGIEVNDFIKNTASNINESGKSFTSVARTGDYHIFYIPPDELFVISITSYPFDEHRPLAENVLLDTLAISQEEACTLNVDVTTPMFANPDKAGEVYVLSFCSNNN